MADEDRDQTELSHEDLEGEEALELPDREAMSLITPSGPAFPTTWPPEMAPPATAD